MVSGLLPGMNAAKLAKLFRSVPAVSSDRAADVFEAFVAELNDAPVLLYVFDLGQMSIAYSNRDAAAFLGYTPEQVQAGGESFFLDIVHPEDRPFARNHLADFVRLSDGETIEFEQRVLHADGEWRRICICERIFQRRADTVPCQILGMVLDITERKQAEQSIRESEGRPEASGISNEKRADPLIRAQEMPGNLLFPLVLRNAIENVCFFGVVVLVIRLVGGWWHGIGVFLFVCYSLLESVSLVHFLITGLMSVILAPITLYHGWKEERSGVAGSLAHALLVDAAAFVRFVEQAIFVVYFLFLYRFLFR